MSFENLLETIRLVITLIASVAIPIVIFTVGNRITNLRQLEEKLRNDRIEIYNKILEPFLLIFSTEAIIQGSLKHKNEKPKTGVELATEKLLNLDYQAYSFKLSLIGSDEVFRAYNNLMQAYFNLNEAVDDNTKMGEHLIMYMAVLLLEVRKSLGNDTTKLHALEMLEWKITDLRKKYKMNNKYPSMEKYQK
jgi:hypothetical protein